MIIPFSVGVSPGGPNATCLTCILGPNCTYNAASFASTGHYYMHICLGPGVPYYTMRATHFYMSEYVLDNLCSNLILFS